MMLIMMMMIMIMIMIMMMMMGKFGVKGGLVFVLFHRSVVDRRSDHAFRTRTPLQQGQRHARSAVLWLRGAERDTSPLPDI